MCDTWMNLTLKEVVQSSPVRSSFFRWSIYAAQFGCDTRKRKLTGEGNRRATSS